MSESRTGTTATTTIAAAFVIGIEGAPTRDDYDGVVQRLGRCVRPWDRVVELAPASVGVVCTALSSAREVDAIAARLADAVRAPIAVGDDIRTFGACVGSSTAVPGEAAAAALRRAGDAMRQMRAARAGLLAPDVPAPRAEPVVLPR